MELRKKIGIGLTVALFLAVGVGIWWNWPDDPEKMEQEVTVRQMMDRLAAATKTDLGNAEDFTVQVTGSAMPIGTVLRVASTIPVDDESCLAVPEPAKRAAPRFNESLKISRDLAGTFGLAEIVPALGGSRMGAKSRDELELSFENVGIRLLTDSKLAALLRKPECRDSFGNQARWVVRGYVVGTRRLVIRNMRDNSLAADIEDLSNFSVSASGNNELTLIDAVETPFLQLVSLVEPPAPGEAIKVAEAAVVAAGAAPGLLYIQRDAADSAQGAQWAATTLEDASFSVANGIETIASDKMPSTPQVRYFNDSDRAAAIEAAEKLRPQYGDVQVVQVGLPAPKGQLEAWLTKR